MIDFIDPQNQPAYWAMRIQQTEKYLDHLKVMHQQAIQSIARLAIHQTEQE